MKYSSLLLILRKWARLVLRWEGVPWKISGYDIYEATTIPVHDGTLALRRAAVCGVPAA